MPSFKLFHRHHFKASTGSLGKIVDNSFYATLHKKAKHHHKDLAVHFDEPISIVIGEEKSMSDSSSTMVGTSASDEFMAASLDNMSIFGYMDLFEKYIKSHEDYPIRPVDKHNYISVAQDMAVAKYYRQEPMFASAKEASKGFMDDRYQKVLKDMKSDLKDEVLRTSRRPTHSKMAHCTKAPKLETIEEVREPREDSDSALVSVTHEEFLEATEGKPVRRFAFKTVPQPEPQPVPIVTIQSVEVDDYSDLPDFEDFAGHNDYSDSESDYGSDTDSLVGDDFASSLSVGTLRGGMGSMDDDDDAYSLASIESGGSDNSNTSGLSRASSVLSDLSEGVIPVDDDTYNYYVAQDDVQNPEFTRTSSFESVLTCSSLETHEFGRECSCFSGLGSFFREALHSIFSRH